MDEQEYTNQLWLQVFMAHTPSKTVEGAAEEARKAVVEFEKHLYPGDQE